MRLPMPCKERNIYCPKLKKICKKEGDVGLLIRSSHEKEQWQAIRRLSSILSRISRIILHSEVVIWTVPWDGYAKISMNSTWHVHVPNLHMLGVLAALTNLEWSYAFSCCKVSQACSRKFRAGWDYQSPPIRHRLKVSWDCMAALYFEDQ